MAINFDSFYFFNEVGKINQENWPNYFKYFLTDGVLYGVGNSLQVYADSTGMNIKIKSGIAYVNTHRGENLAEIVLPVVAANPTYPRVDLVVARAVYDIAPNSYMCFDVKAGVPSSSPVAPNLTQTAGVTWEIPLAWVSVGAGVNTITSGAVTDKRKWSTLPFSMGGTGAKTQTEALSNIFGGSQLAISQGGTGASTAAGARTNLGFGSAAVLQTITKQTTLATGSWSSGVITISDGDVQANSIILIDPVEDSRSAFFASDIRKNSQGSGSYSLKCTTTPTANLVCDVTIMRVG